ncbi:MAG TPA: hypothetical protein VF647_04875 [Longimicrobium sp.]|jgi:hypothetical protein
MSTYSNTILPDAVNTSRPGYPAMRMVAEWASGVRGENLYFGFDGTDATLTDAPESGALPVFTRPFTRRPTVEHVYFTVPTNVGSDTLKINGRETSALFWGESAVEKFLFPYFASVAGSEAASLFQKVAHAWYDYPADRVQVCAVAYECGPAAPTGTRRLTLEGMVALVCLVDETLEKMSLAEFARRFPGQGTGPVAPPQPLEVFRDEPGWALSPGVESIVARDAAEFVSGLRGHTVRLRQHDGKLDPWISEGGPGRHLPGTWIEAGMERVRSDRPVPSRVAVQVAGAEVQVVIPAPAAPYGDPTRVPDSIFWSDGAVEKLLVPYYGSVKGLSAPFFTTVLLGAWNGLVRRDSPLGPCAVLEIFRNFLGTAADGGGESRAAEDDPIDETPYAVTHLPRSEYIPTLDEPPTQGLEGRTHFLTIGREPEALARFTRG